MKINKLVFFTSLFSILFLFACHDRAKIETTDLTGGLGGPAPAGSGASGGVVWALATVTKTIPHGGEDESKRNASINSISKKYTYDDSGRISKIEELIGEINWVTTITYEGATASLSSAAGANRYEEKWYFDELGRRTKVEVLHPRTREVAYVWTYFFPNGSEQFSRAELYGREGPRAAAANKPPSRPAEFHVFHYDEEGRLKDQTIHRGNKRVMKAQTSENGCLEKAETYRPAFEESVLETLYLYRCHFSAQGEFMGMTFLERENEIVSETVCEENVSIHRLIRQELKPEVEVGRVFYRYDENGNVSRTCTNEANTCTYYTYVQVSKALNPVFPDPLAIVPTPNAQALWGDWEWIDIGPGDKADVVRRGNFPSVPEEGVRRCEVVEGDPNAEERRREAEEAARELAQANARIQLQIQTCVKAARGRTVQFCRDRECGQLEAEQRAQLPACQGD